MINLEKRETAKLVEFGRGGDRVHFGSGHASSGYGTPDNPHAADPACYIFPDGTPAIDKRDAVKTPEGFSWVFKGPLVDVDLPPGTVDKLNLGASPAPAEGQEDMFGALVALQRATADTENLGPLDTVDARTYIEGWRRHGARIGHYQNNVVVWDT